jgi:probable selenium-dependent hydroxylase accessory protein YqeC
MTCHPLNLLRDAKFAAPELSSCATANRRYVGTVWAMIKRDTISMNADLPNVNLVDVLHARSGLICLVGAGGKKTTLYRLAAFHPGRVGITSTVYIQPFPKLPVAAQVIADEDAIVSAVMKAAATRRIVAFALTSSKRGRLGGLSCSQVAQIHAAAGFDITSIKSDGARGRWIKAPDVDEPQIPKGSSTVIPVVSARVIGMRLSERIAHRIDRITAVTGACSDEPITPGHVARLLTSENGALRGVGAATVVPLINMVDSAELEVAARQAAEQALILCKGRFQRVVLASMRRSDPIVNVVGH